jgi:methylglutaconyl-CoA hydratase
MPSTLTVTEAGPVLRVTLNRPEVRNAFNEALIDELTAWAGSVAPGGTCRAVVLAGAGKAFCAGADLAWMSKMVGYSKEQNLADARRAARVFELLDALPVPLIGRIHGAALGGGSGLAAVCDIAVAADDAMFGFTEAKLGILPSMISPFVVAKIGQSAARELFLTAARFTAARAREIGLVHRVVPAADLDHTIDTLVAEILTSAPEAVAAAKALIPRVAGRAPSDVVQLTTETIARHRTSREGQEGMRAFLEKRKAPWVP